jgi:hypothetical protein
MLSHLRMAKIFLAFYPEFVSVAYSETDGVGYFIFG